MNKRKGFEILQCYRSTKLTGFQGLLPDFKFSVIQEALAFLSYRLCGARADRVGEVFQGH